MRPAKASVNVAFVSTVPEIVTPAFFSVRVTSSFPAIADIVTTGGMLSILHVTL